MSMPISDKAPLLVRVHEEGWDAYSLHDPATEQDEQLFALLKRLGGINEKVPPGVYRFNAVALTETDYVLSLDQIVEE